VHGAVTSSLADQYFMLLLQLVTAQVTNLPLGFRTGLELGLWHFEVQRRTATSRGFLL